MKKKIRPKTDHLNFIYSYATGKEVLSYRPFFLMIEPTNACNLRCKMCPQNGLLKRKKGMMNLDLYKEIIDDCKDYVQAIHLYHSGESLLHENLPEMVEYASKRGIYVIINTNATMLTPEMSEKLILSGLDFLSISFDGFDPEIYEKIRIGADFQKTLQNIKDFFYTRQQMGKKNPRTALEILKMNETSEKIPEFTKKARELGAEEVRVWKYHNWSESSMDNRELLPGTGKHFPCEYPYNIMAVLWEGQVVPCCLDYDGKYIIGDVREKSLLEIWNDLPLRELRKKLSQRRENEIELCRNCSFLREPKSYYTIYGKLFKYFSGIVGLFRRKTVEVKETQ
ncbi:MAG: SPASM domain-containing protein [Candidatus Eremiobacteraeota bacterium]|nr:SPASM domain-containing protein [Candidatus Eremiobacteraeota bacterium]